MIIRRLENSDLTALEIFYHEHHSSRPRLHNMKLWSWEFMENPANQDELIPFYIIEDNNKIRGTIGAIPFKININGEIYSACHPVNYFISPEYKGLPALRLLKAIMSEYTVLLSSYISNDATKLFKAARFANLGEYVYDYFYTISPSNQTSTSSILVSIKSKLIALIRNSWVTLLSIYLNIKLNKYETIITNQPEIDDSTLKELTKTYNGIIKDPAYLIWRYKNSPVLNCIFYSTRSGNKIANTIVVHIDQGNNQAIILDILGQTDNPDLLKLLLIRVIKDCKKRKINIILTTALNIFIENLLSYLAFSKTKSDFGLMLYSKNKELRSSLTEHSKWHFVLGDTDRY